MSVMEEVQHLKIPLEEIKLATNNFGDENFIARGGFGRVYMGTLTTSGQQSNVAVKRLDRAFGQGEREFLIEIQMLSCYRHKNLITLVGFCDEGGENILVYEHAKHGSLDKHLSNANLSWMQRLQISVGAAHALAYLHNQEGHKVVHRDIKSSNILLDENWEAKISDFGLSKIGPSDVDFTFVVTRACGTFGYVDPQYMRTGILTKESDVYSFGVVLLEMSCGRLATPYQDERKLLVPLAQEYYEKNKLREIIHPNLVNQMKVESLNMFSQVAYQCLKENRRERPTMDWIVENLEEALKLQELDSEKTVLIERCRNFQGIMQQDDSSTMMNIKPKFPNQEHLKCPRCDSSNTKFCYFNNYALSQPRHFCKNCRRYWTRGGNLRFIPVGGGTRNHTKRSSNSNKRGANSSSSSIMVAAPPPPPAEQRPEASGIFGYGNDQIGGGGSFSSLLGGQFAKLFKDQNPDLETNYPFERPYLSFL